MFKKGSNCWQILLSQSGCHILAFLHQMFYKMWGNQIYVDSLQLYTSTWFWDDERKILNYFYYISHELRSNDTKRGEIFAMKGGKKQLGFTSIRYHLGFCGYASAVACAKLSAYPSHIKEILSALIEHMLDYSVWCYSVEMWPGDSWIL